MRDVFAFEVAFLEGGLLINRILLPKSGTKSRSLKGLGMKTVATSHGASIQFRSRCNVSLSFSSRPPELPDSSATCQRVMLLFIKSIAFLFLRPCEFRISALRPLMVGKQRRKRNIFSEHQTLGELMRYLPIKSRKGTRCNSNHDLRF